MSEGRTVWWAKDAAWWRREAIVELGEEVGPIGPAVVDWLTCEAKAQGTSGQVKAGYRTLARGVFSDVSTVCPVVSLSVRLGLLDDFEEGDRTFTCRISGWESEQKRAVEAAKKQRQRKVKPPESSMDEPDSPDPESGQNGTCPAVSPSVPESPPTGQDRTDSGGGGGSVRATNDTDIDLSSSALHPHLGDVLPILRDAREPNGRELVVEEMSIDSALRAHRDRDPLRAAHEVAAMVREGRNRTSSASSLLLSRLERQKPSTPAAAASTRRSASSRGRGRFEGL